MAVIEVPSSFRAMPRWWDDADGRTWLSTLPTLVAEQCARWSLQVDGTPWHGSNALVVPVRREAERLALRLAPPGDDVAQESLALQRWDGHGTVRLVEFDEPARALLLERLDGDHSLQGEPLATAIVVLAELTRVLAVPVPADVPSTESIAAAHVEGFGREWAELGEPTTPGVRERAVALAADLACAPAGDRAVDGDLHFGQVLAATRAPWLVVDPVLLRGDPEYDLARVLWSRLDELADDADVRRAFDSFVATAGVPPERARAWVMVRSMSYLLWGLRAGLTWDPPRCRRLLRIFG